MSKIPKAERRKNKRIQEPVVAKTNRIEKATAPDTDERPVVFSFEALEKNEYFNLDCNCPNWFNDLLDVLKVVSDIELKRIRSGEFSKVTSTLRIHPHSKATPPCSLPRAVEDISEFYQIRIALSKGGVHGIFIKNIFYIVWLDPLHNMYPSENHGGLRVIRPPATCCMDRDSIVETQLARISELEQENKRLNDDIDALLER